MYEKIERCPNCENAEFTNYLICEDHLISHESFAITECTRCGLLLTNPRPKENELARYYESDQYISHTNQGSSFTNAIYKVARRFNLRRKHKLISNLSEKGSILDYGCGTGEWLAHCKSQGWAVFGLEPNAKARSQAERLLNVTIATGDEELDDDLRFEIITLWHVLEHLPDPNATLNLLSKKVKKKGKIVIAVPNPKSYDAQKFREFWAGYDLPRHLFHFSKDAMTSLLNKNGLKVSAILPLTMDAYYVSLLSNKYLKASASSKLLPLDYFKSFVTGWKSNDYAKKDTNYSSLIYVAGK